MAMHDFSIAGFLKLMIALAGGFAAGSATAYFGWHLL